MDTHRLVLLRYTGLAGTCLLAIAAYLGGAFPTTPDGGTPWTVLRGTNGGWIVSLWIVGTALLVNAWIRGLRTPFTAKWAAVTGALWMIPMLVAPPFGSRDVYSYACQGSIFGAGRNPYHEGVSVLPCPWLDSVSATWQHTTTPYGSAWVLLEGAAVKLGGSLTGSVVVFRVIAVLGIAATGWGIVVLARALGMPVDRAIWIAISS